MMFYFFTIMHVGAIQQNIINLLTTLKRYNVQKIYLCETKKRINVYFKVIMPYVPSACAIMLKKYLKIKHS